MKFNQVQLSCFVVKTEQTDRESFRIYNNYQCVCFPNTISYYLPLARQVHELFTRGRHKLNCHSDHVIRNLANGNVIKLRFRFRLFIIKDPKLCVCCERLIRSIEKLSMCGHSGSTLAFNAEGSKFVLTSPLLPDELMCQPEFDYRRNTSCGNLHTL